MQYIVSFSFTFQINFVPLEFSNKKNILQNVIFQQIKFKLVQIN